MSEDDFKPASKDEAKSTFKCACGREAEWRDNETPQCHICHRISLLLGTVTYSEAISPRARAITNRSTPFQQKRTIEVGDPGRHLLNKSYLYLGDGSTLESLRREKEKKQ